MKPSPAPLFLFTALLLFTSLLLGCGSTSPTPAPSNPHAAFSGNWETAANPITPGVLPTPIADFSGALQFTGNNVTGTLRAFAPGSPATCPSLTTDLPVTGTLDAAANLTLTAPLSGGVATITATLPTDPQTFIPGSYQIVGGTCPMPATPMVLSQYASATGTFTGTLNQLDLTTHAVIPGTATAVVAVLTQSIAPNADGQFPLSGTVTASGACTGTLAFTDGIVFGNALLSRAFSSPTVPAGILNGAIDPTATTFRGDLALFAFCNSHNYQGTLTRQ